MSRPDSFVVGSSRASLAFYRFARFLVAVITRSYTRMTIVGREHIPATGPFVLAPVHRSYVDTPIAGCLTTRRLRFMGKDSMWKVRWVGWVLSALGAIPVTRGTADREALRRSVELLESGEPMVLFPEGERKEGPVIQPLFDGAVYVALKARVPIVPVGIAGSERVMPKGARFIFPKKVHVVIGAPIVPEAGDLPEGSRVPRAVLAQQSALLHAELQRLFDLAMTRVGWSYEVDGQVPEPDQ
ncbi:MAG: lysophospholipid acyltransferase family protein [Ilumatobacteraceae bacterium]